MEDDEQFKPSFSCSTCKSRIPSNLVQEWYADDAQAGGRLDALAHWFWKLVRKGPLLGYHAKLTKCFLVVKPHRLEEAERIFAGSGVQIVAGGKRDLGAAIGCEAFIERFLKEKVAGWTGMVERLAVIARSQPHAAHAALTQGLSGKWKFSQRTMPELREYLQPLEDAIRLKFLPKLFGKEQLPITDDFRSLLALPARNAGMGLFNPVEEAPHAHADSVEFTAQMVSRIMDSSVQLDLDREELKKAKKAIRQRRIARNDGMAAALGMRAEPKLRRAMALAQEKGASAVISARPLERYGFAFKCKRDYTDLMRMRYRMRLEFLPEVCACGAKYSLDHSQICQKGGFIHMRHDDCAKMFAGVTKEVFNGVEYEPPLIPLSGEQMRLKSANIQDGARSDVRVRGFWGQRRNAFFDFTVFYPFASSHCNKNISQLYKNAEKKKKREYGQRVNEVNDGDFTPMVMSSAGGMGKEMSIAIKHVAALIAQKRNETYSVVVAVLRAKFSFAIARAALICLRGSRSLAPMVAAAGPLEPVDLAVAELGL